jgi:hypothetical protein
LFGLHLAGCSGSVEQGSSGVSSGSTSTSGSASSSSASSGAGGATGVGGGTTVGSVTSSSTSTSTSTGAGGTGGGPPPVAVKYPIQPSFFDAVVDTDHDLLFLSYGQSGTVDAVSLVDGKRTTITTSFHAEHLALDTSKHLLVVSVPITNHSSYYFDQHGNMALIDTNTLANPFLIPIAFDPWQVVTDNKGHAFVSGASGQWTSLLSLDLSSYVATPGPSDMLYEMTAIRMHPAGDRVYGADNEIVPDSVHRYNVKNGLGTYGAVSPYWGDYQIGGDIRVDPTGNALFTRDGNVFTASNDHMTDMYWLGILPTTWKDLAFNPSGDTAYLLADSDGSFQSFDAATFASKPVSPNVAPAARLLETPKALVVLRDGPSAEVEVIPYPLL